MKPTKVEKKLTNPHTDLSAFKMRFESHRWSSANNFEQVANLLCAHVNSVSYPHWYGK